jgi:hypothetical protein
MIFLNSCDLEKIHSILLCKGEDEVFRTICHFHIHFTSLWTRVSNESIDYIVFEVFEYLYSFQIYPNDFIICKNYCYMKISNIFNIKLIFHLNNFGIK